METETTEAPAPKKPPRKPRPSEIAAKKSKAALAAASLAKKAKAPKRKAPAKKKAVKRPFRCERLDMRLSKAEKAKLVAVAKKKKVTVTNVVWGLIAKVK